jgi:chromosome condensin MukBEF ATPase and DNA-binding subunit MukB
MSRARIAALALVNWKGVFYERYLLDRHVTALEGANGAGKTTVMIAAYVVLLPDMSKLRFTNLGESGAASGAGSASRGGLHMPCSISSSMGASACSRACGWFARASRPSSRPRSS